MGPIGIQELLVTSLLLVGFLSGFAFWIWMLVDCATKEADEGNTKIVWVIIIVFANIVGAIVYWLVRRPQRQAELHRKQGAMRKWDLPPTVPLLDLKQQHATLAA